MNDERKTADAPRLPFIVHRSDLIVPSMTAAGAQPLLAAAAGRPFRWSSVPVVGRGTVLHTLLAGLLYLFFAAFLILPIVWVVATGFVTKDGSFTLRYVGLVFRD